ncbi:MAG: CDP-alcohol phosphatidyltransferase family protein [Rhodoferax sp.]
MLDRWGAQQIQPMVQRLARTAHRLGLSANAITLIGFALGLLAALSIAQAHYLSGALLIALSRLADGLDGAVARLTQPTDAGGFLDITLDFLFYASIPLAFAWADPPRNALPAAVLLASFIGTGSSFLAFAVLAAKRQMHNPAMPNKSFYFLGGLTEATETLACFWAMCFWPESFIELAYGFAALCVMTTVMRIVWGWQRLR